MLIYTKPYIGKKIGANIVDYGITFLIFNIYMLNFGIYNTNLNVYSLEGLGVLPIIVYWFIYHILIEYFFSKTLGHFIFGLKVISVNGTKTNLIQNLKRHLLDFIDILPWGIPAIIVISNTKNNQRLGDLWAKTIVIRINEKAIRNFYSRSKDEQDKILSNIHCEKCNKSGMGLESVNEYSTMGNVFISGFCNSCGKEIIKEINC